MWLQVIALASGHSWRQKLRRTLDVRLVTAWVFGPRFFCGQYVLAVCTDETSANYKRDGGWSNHQLFASSADGIDYSPTALVWQWRLNLIFKSAIDFVIQFDGFWSCPLTTPTFSYGD